MSHSFRNDYSSLCHPRILKALEEFSLEQNITYGLDRHSEKASEYIRKIFNTPNADIHYLVGGTLTNVTFISYALRPYEGVIAVKSAHINVHETAAVEASGHKIFTVEGKDGKLYPEDVIKALKANTDEHMVKLKLVYISNSTETGTIYSKQELLDLAGVCREFGLYLFIDGARLGSALTSKYNDVEPELLGTVCDAFYIGGAKNGLLLGEALVINNPDLQDSFRYHIKNRGAMISKGYLLGIQFEEAFKDGLYFEIAKETNNVADYLKEELNKIGYETPNSPTNQVFVTVCNNLGEDIIKEFDVELWEKKENEITIRFVVSFVTTKNDVDNLINYLRNYK
ncbi:MAG: aminotransferase class I/II-fold pyridoxal phosphate-dependent enzyme [Bacilli bacterium]|nr:aminotransferase class I/II-fold pyridoxal phosphate-dependent enzyme [Bacilli bacterium]